MRRVTEVEKDDTGGRKITKEGPGARFGFLATIPKCRWRLYADTAVESKRVLAFALRSARA